jgi:hypothetical protein
LKKELNFCEKKEIQEKTEIQITIKKLNTKISNLEEKIVLTTPFISSNYEIYKQNLKREKIELERRLNFLNASFVFESVICLCHRKAIYKYALNALPLQVSAIFIF